MSFVKNRWGARVSVAWVMMALAVSASAQEVAGTEPAKEARPKAAPRIPLRALEDMIEKARADLAMRIGAKPTEITLAGWKTVQLPARVLRCEAAQGEAGEPAVAGYRIVLVYKARDYTYNSDMQAVTACPRIEAS
jgi:hypothetical protein